MRIRNLTPHALHLVVGDQSVTLEPEGVCPRVTMSFVQSGELDVGKGIKVPTGRTEPGEVTELPDEEDGVVLVVSRIVASAAPARCDLVFPDDLVRDDKGRVVGARRLSCV